MAAEQRAATGPAAIPALGSFSAPGPFVTACAALVIALITSALGWMMRGIVNDDAFITYRYAQNLLAGRGFVFNPGEAVLGTTAPLHGLLIAALGALDADLPRVALAVSCTATVIMAFCVYLTLANRGAVWGGAVAAAFLICAHKTYSAFPLETPLLGAFQAAAVLFAERGRLRLMGAALALALLVRADSALLAAALLGTLWWTGAPKRALTEAFGVTTALIAPWFLYASVTYGSLLSNTAHTKSGWPGHLWVFMGSLWERGVGTTLSDPWLSALALLVAAYGAVVSFRQLRWAPLRALVLWALAHVAAYSALRIFWPHSWYYYPLHICVCMLLGIGCDHGLSVLRARARARFESEAISHLLAPSFALVVALLAAPQIGAVHENAGRIPFQFFAGGRDALYRSAAAWLSSNPTVCAHIAALEVGTLAYYSDRTMVDRMGLVSPEAGAEMKRTNQRTTSVPWTAARYDVDCFVLTGSPRGEWPRVLHGATAYRLARTFTHGPSQSLLAVYSR